VQTVSKTMPETNIHRGDEEVGGKQSHAHYHNVSVQHFEGITSDSTLDLQWCWRGFF